ncbi:diaminopimelate decarboxylase [Caldibacillus lycopersici]|uniref:Diaminopimelate decarboxylase n=1 Tax=Perspicuibacillus lycopersici TaxID=1325689 RepID=A0AAE3IUC3_9BACI|nr:diaminopimelate decarboxylase [Perspicuibacillus lycopersici]MCU9613758.1 diaminopimelate decarboxylase [Perspicuibacillus lycopersici]
MFLYGTMGVNELGNLEIGGCDTVELTKQFGTPLYVYDIELIRNRARSFLRTFKNLQINGQVAYASKAFSTIAILEIMNEEGLSLDVVSGGELYTALKANFPTEKIHFHGNNKSYPELEMAIDCNIGCIVVDNFYELGLVDEICKRKNKQANILLRVTPGIEAHTHEYILTGQEDSKFGFDLQNGQAKEALQKSLELSTVNVLGVHCHIGSQIFETRGFIIAIEKIYDHLINWKTDLQYEPKILNVGGGFGIRYTDSDHPMEPENYVEAIIHEVSKQVETHNLLMPEIWIEPGRSLVGDAGTTLYTIGSQKEVPDVRHYVSVDGGMSDNIRPALYQAKYEAIIANKVLEATEETVSIAGKACESGDMLIWDIALPKAEAGDVLAVFCTGAYGYSMASNYNRLPRPAVVFVEQGHAKLVVKRETYEDLIKLDLSLQEVVKK